MTLDPAFNTPMYDETSARLRSRRSMPGWVRFTSEDDGLMHMWARNCDAGAPHAVDLAISRMEPEWHGQPGLLHIPLPEWHAFVSAVDSGLITDYLEGTAHAREDGAGQAPQDEGQDDAARQEADAAGLAAEATQDEGARVLDDLTIARVDLIPAGLSFNPPVTVTKVADNAEDEEAGDATRAEHDPA